MSTGAIILTAAMGILAFGGLAAAWVIQTRIKALNNRDAPVRGHQALVELLTKSKGEQGYEDRERAQADN